MSSTANRIRQLGEQLEINRTHSRLAVGVLLFQDLAFAPLLALATALGASADVLSPAWLARDGRARRAGPGARAARRRWLLRPLFARCASPQLGDFHAHGAVRGARRGLATHALGLSMALGGFLAGMLLAETEFRHQTRR